MFSSMLSALFSNHLFLLHVEQRSLWASFTNTFPQVEHSDGEHSEHHPVDAESAAKSPQLGQTSKSGRTSSLYSATDYNLALSRALAEQLGFVQQASSCLRFLSD
jgi:hypothetical protein